MKQTDFLDEENRDTAFVGRGLDAGNIERMRSYLHEDYLAIYEIDTTTGGYTTVLTNADKHCGNVPFAGMYSEIFTDDVFRNYVGSDYRTELAEATTLHRLIKTLSVEKRTEFEFETGGEKREWRKVIFSAADKNANGVPNNILVAFSEINESAAERLKQQKEIIDAFRREQELGEVRMDFISRIGHDIRTPLNAIVGMSMIARNDINDRGMLEDCLTKIEVASDQILSLVNGLLDIGKAESARENVANEPFDIAEIIESVSTVAEPLAMAKRHLLEISTENIKHEMVSGDVQRILRIINNLVGNAIKYTPDGGRITVLFSEEDERSDGRFNYKVKITDNGYGMSEDFLKNIFNPFVRGIDKRVSDLSGTGLGMAITHNLIDMIGGTIDIKSELDVGTQVVVTFPLTIYGMGKILAPVEATAKGVLVLCEGEMCPHKRCTASGRCLKEVLEEQGIPVDTATSIDSARFMIDAKKSKGSMYYMAVVNVKQYSEDVGNAAIKLRIHLGASIPIMLTTDRDWLAIELDARSKGVNFFLKRPVFVKNMTKVLKKIQDQQISEEEVEQKKLPSCEGKRILVVEDNDVNAQILIAILSTSGAVIERAKNGKEAYDLVKENSGGWFDLILMDIEMPVMDGCEATIAIRAMDDTDRSRIPIIAMTADAFSTDAAKARAAGMSDHLTKPVQIDKLTEALRRYLD